jgi:hypothetical protein
MVIDHKNYKWSPDWQLCIKMIIFNNYVLKWWKFGFLLFGPFLGNDLKATRIVFMSSSLCALQSLVNAFFVLVFLPFLEVLWSFLFCSSFALKWYECAFFISNVHYLSHSFILASLLLMTIWKCLIPIVTFIECQLISKKCAFTDETLCVFVVVCITPSTSFVKSIVFFCFYVHPFVHARCIVILKVEKMKEEGGRM